MRKRNSRQSRPIASNSRELCEMIYAEANRAFTVALDYRMPIDAMVATWNLNSHPDPVWGPLGRIDSRFGTWFYRTYEHSDLQRSCVGCMLESDSVSNALSSIRTISCVNLKTPFASVLPIRAWRS